MSLCDVSFSDRLLAWFDVHGRHDLPWQHPVTPYRVWVSEIMLQQTQVVTVIPYFERFMHSFPSVERLASATLDEVLAHWSGLGYYARGRNLHKAAQIIMSEYDGIFPKTVSHLISLPGIGLSTAHAILSLSDQQATAICDGNVRRVLSRWSALEQPIEQQSAQKKLWALAQTLQSVSRAGHYTQAIMDLGATLCTRKNPRCAVCPVALDCAALLSGHDVTRWPIKHPKKQKPTRECKMFLLKNESGAIWLQAPTSVEGLWGGLYQLPQVLPSGFDHAPQVVLPVMKHIFTHFILLIEPFVIHIENVARSHLSANGVWYNFGDQSIARPAIVDKLIQQCLKT